MKKSYIYSAILGGTFFAVPYAALGIGILPSALIGVAAYGAGSLMFKYKNKANTSLGSDENLYDILKEAKEQIASLRKLCNEVEDAQFKQNIKSICGTADKIVEAISKTPSKAKQAHNFLNYYLPLTIKMVSRYDEIENQRMNSQDSKNFMESIRKMIVKVDEAFGEQLNNLYKPEMLDTDAEIKVFETMLKSDGFLDKMDFNINKGEEK